MMTGLGHEVILYGGNKNEAAVSEFVPVGKPKNDPLHIPHFDAAEPLFSDFSLKVIEKMKDRIQPRDFICIIGGAAQQAIADAFPDNMAVEYGIGYSGVFAKYKVFESYAWMHMIYGASAEPHSVDGRYYDAVIPNYFDPDEFTYQAEPMGYYLFLGRMVDRKGWRVAVDVCEELGVPLVLAGHGDPGKLPSNCEYVGAVGPRDRDRLLGGAIATFTPTSYIEPFCGVHVESMLCGTPVITTDWGVFTETVVPGVGFRCRTRTEFCDATKRASDLDRWAISDYARSKFTTGVVAPQYDAYFRRLMTLWDDGWYTK